MGQWNQRLGIPCSARESELGQMVAPRRRKASWDAHMDRMDDRAQTALHNDAVRNDNLQECMCGPGKWAMGATVEAKKNRVRY